MAERARNSTDIIDKVTESVSIINGAFLLAESDQIPRHLRGPLLTLLNVATEKLEVVAEDLSTLAKKVSA
jgi:hypothetical protein